MLVLVLDLVHENPTILILIYKNNAAANLPYFQEASR